MEKSKQIIFQPEVASRNSQLTETAQLSSQNLKPQQPFQILDIRYGKGRNNFVFIVSLYESHRINKRVIVLHKLDDLTEEYKNWLLAKFKKNLRGLALIETMKGWVLDRLAILQEYCYVNDIVFDALYSYSNSPPAQIYKSVPVKVNLSSNDDQLIPNNTISSVNGSTKRKKKCKSVKDSKQEGLPVQTLSKNARLKAVYNQFKVMIAKYRTKKSINRQEVLEELDCVRAYIYDY